jgi:hypothetical protein
VIPLIYFGLLSIDFILETWIGLGLFCGYFSCCCRLNRVARSFDLGFPCSGQWCMEILGFLLADWSVMRKFWVFLYELAEWPSDQL